MNERGKFVKLMDWIMNITWGVREMFIVLAVIIVYFEFIFPKLSWSTWIITPVLILAMLGGMWRFIRDAFVNESKSKQEVKNGRRDSPKNC